MNEPDEKTVVPRMYTGYNHTVPIGGEQHDVQTEYIVGDPPKIVSHAFVAGQVVASSTIVVQAEDLEDELKVRALIKQQQVKTIRRLVVQDRQRRQGAPTTTARKGRRRGERSDASDPTARVPRSSASAVADPEEVRAAVDVRRELVQFSRAVEEMGRGEPLARLGRLVEQSQPVSNRGFDGSRSEEMAQVLLMRADAIECVEAGDPERAAELVEQMVPLARRLTEVNHRAELQDHDRRQWRRSLERLEGLPAEDAPSSEDLRELQSTWGRDRAVDQLLDDARGLRCGPLRLALAEALLQLEGEMQER